MKKMVVLVLFLVMSMSLCAAAETFPSGWYSLRSDDGIELSLFYLPECSSITLPDSVTLLPVEVSGFTAGAGYYTVGDEIPAGKYSLSATDVWPGFVNYEIRNANGKMILAGVLDYEENAVIGNIKLEEGYVVRLQDGATHFSPSSGGIVFDN